MDMNRCSGILLHPTSLPGPYGIGEIGREAYEFIDFLEETGQSLWQVLPLGPTGYGDSPYQSFSAFAGNPLLISLNQLQTNGWLTDQELAHPPSFSTYLVEYGHVIGYKFDKLTLAAQRFHQHYLEHGHDDFDQFCTENHWWLHDYAMFYAIKEAHQGKVWNTWEKRIAMREPDAMQAWSEKLADKIFFVKYWQYEFFTQWINLKHYASERQIKIIGDLPIYVAYDSADVWSQPDLYYLDDARNPTVVAGVPPDYFSETGQLWGNPIYRWDEMKQNQYEWWVDRFKQSLRFFDIVRLDHFRGFEAYWEVPAGDETAENGRWVKGPGAELFEAIEQGIGGLPIIAENLGLITKEVEDLRKQFDLPGMAVLQFAFDPNTMNSDYLPHNFVRNLVVYTGTHDNDTMVGWWDITHNETAMHDEYARRERDFASLYMDVEGKPIHWVSIRTLMRSVADVVVVPLQDVLGLGNDARMNKPGSSMGNWGWRFSSDQLSPAIREQLFLTTKVFNRLNDFSRLKYESHESDDV